MVTGTLTVKNPSGLHARPASIFASAAKRFQSRITITHGDESCNGKSIIGILAGGISCGSEILLSADGEDEQDALRELSALVEAGCGE